MIDPRKGIEEVCKIVLSGDIKDKKHLVEAFHKNVLDYFYEGQEEQEGVPTPEQENMMATLFDFEYKKLLNGVEWLKHKGSRGQGPGQGAGLGQGPGQGAGWGRGGNRPSLTSVSFDFDRVKAAVLILAALRAMKSLLCRLTMVPAQTPLQFATWDTTNFLETIKKQTIDTLEALLSTYANVKAEGVKQNFAQYMIALRDVLKK